MFHTGCVSTPSTRRYDSTRRQLMAEQTRADVLAAAMQLFVERGWAGTSVRDVARAAGCSVETIYASVGSKRELLKVALDIAVVGDDEPVALLERPAFRGVQRGSVSERATAAAGLIASIYRRTARLDRVLEQASSSDAELAELWRRDRANYRASSRALLTAVADRPVADTEVDAMAAVLGSAVYFTLTYESGWSDEQYQTWAADVMLRLLDVEREVQQ